VLVLLGTICSTTATASINSALNCGPQK